MAETRLAREITCCLGNASWVACSPSPPGLDGCPVQRRAAAGDDERIELRHCLPRARTSRRRDGRRLQEWLQRRGQRADIGGGDDGASPGALNVGSNAGAVGADHRSTGVAPYTSDAADEEDSVDLGGR